MHLQYITLSKQASFFSEVIPHDMCRPALFCVPPVAHMIPYGLAKDFIKMWLRDSKKAPTADKLGGDLRLSKAARDLITARCKQLRSTDSYRKSPIDLVRCVHSVLCARHRMQPLHCTLAPYVCKQAARSYKLTHKQQCLLYITA